MFASSWPQAEGFNAWRAKSKIVVATLDPKTLKATSDFKPVSGLPPAASLHNPRAVLDDAGEMWLFFSESLLEQKCRIGVVQMDTETLAPKTDVVDLFPGFSELGMHPSQLQGPTNPAPYYDSDGRWGMLFRSAAGPGKARQLFHATALAPSGPWSTPHAVGGATDVEDPTVWMQGDCAHAVVRDIGGTVSGKSWPSLAGMGQDATGAWGAMQTPHLCNRSLPDISGDAVLYHRVERPHVLVTPERIILSLAVQPHPDTASTIQLFDWSAQTPYLEKGEAFQFNEPATVETIQSKRLSYLHKARLDSLDAEMARLRERNANGLVVEFGVALGGSGALMAGNMAPGLKFIGYDVFGQIPPPDENDSPRSHERYEIIDSGQSKGISGDSYYGYRDDLINDVKANFARLGAPVDGHRISLVKGLFRDTVDFPESTVIQLAHIDCDWYDPTLFCLNSVAPHIPKWGTIIIDDFDDWEGCRRATHEFLAANPDFRLREVQPHAIIRRFEAPKDRTAT
ncbi:hypothetical protein GCM10009069_05010 [Algimonas arctica]|uniref:Uncharacterized protein n=2 Tax=Algimonas arctica TaxID=1479486 RepID=A0A8J3CQ78_9PROT|nr:hypothetical protein GCM10009069_05010 [Algimonas arctica]